jgi:K+ transporter
VAAVGFAQPAAAAAVIQPLPPHLSSMAINAVGTLGLAAASSFVTWFYKRLSMLDEVRRTKRDLEMKRATEAFLEISTITDQIYFHQAMEIIDVVTRKAQATTIEEVYDKQFKVQVHELQEIDKQSWERYTRVYETFASSESRSLAQIHCSFGYENRDELERIYRVFENAHKTMQATYYYGIRSFSNSKGEWTYEGKEELQRDLANSKRELHDLYEKRLRNIHMTNVGILREGGVD